VEKREPIHKYQFMVLFSNWFTQIHVEFAKKPSTEFAILETNVSKPTDVGLLISLYIDKYHIAYTVYLFFPNHFTNKSITDYF
jgi:hypothetical protein